jgi:flavin-binding protein dodecin
MYETRVTEVVGESSAGFEEAIRRGMAQARSRISNIHGAWVRQQRLVLSGGESVYRVAIKVAYRG